MGQLTYANASVSTAYSTAGLNSTQSGMGHTHSTVGYSSPQSHMTPVFSSPSSHMQGSDRVKQMEQEIHLLRMSVNDKDAQLAQVSFKNDCTYLCIC